MSDRRDAPGSRIAIVGGGAAGLIAAWLLQSDADVTLFEADPVLGGHARTVEVPTPAGPLPVETGFRYLFPHTYPNLTAVLRVLGMPIVARASSMSFRGDGRATLATPPRDVRQALRLLTSPRDLASALSFLWFLTAGSGLLARGDWEPSLEEFLRRARIPRAVARGYLVPALAGCWGAPVEAMRSFPAYDVLKVMKQGKAGAVPEFFDIRGGTSAYVDCLSRQLDEADVRVAAPVAGLRRDGAHWLVQSAAREERFDAVVVATPSWQVAPLFESNAVPEVARIAAAFGWFPTDISIHRDPTRMPPERRAWCGINVEHLDGGRVRTTEWSGLHVGADVFRTWMLPGDPTPRGEVHRRTFKHLVVDARSRSRQRAIADLQGRDALYLAGMYTTDVDNHESAVTSAMTVARLLAPRSRRLAAVDAAR